jgi:hypothetical protein
MLSTAGASIVLRVGLCNESVHNVGPRCQLNVVCNGRSQADSASEPYRCWAA